MIIKNARIVLENRVIVGEIEFTGGVITKIIETGSENFDKTIVPGFIDTHIHGGFGFDFMDGDANGGFETFAKKLLKEGVTSVIQSTVTDSVEKTNQATKAFGKYISTIDKKRDRAEHIGVHIEGKWINKDQKGAHEIKEIVPAEIEWFDELNNNTHNSIRQVTLALEIPENLELAHHLNKIDVIASAGHTNIKMEDALKLFNSGVVKNVTHLYNQMSKYTHRDPGLVPAVLQHDSITAELICDGIHIDPKIIKLTHKLLGPERIILITDAMSAKGMPPGKYKIGQLDVFVKDDGSARLADGQLAGSTLTMIKAFRNIINFSGCSLVDAALMTSTNAAKKYNVYADRGSIKVGKKADLVILNNNLNIIEVIKS